MKKRIVFISLIMVIVLMFTGVSAFATAKNINKSVVLDNDRFYVTLPDGYTYEKGYSSNYYYSNENFDTIEFFVEGNLLFPDGIEKTPEEIINKRFEEFCGEEYISEIKINLLKKIKVNGFSSATIEGTRDDGAFEYTFKAYILTTKETLYIIIAESENGFSDIENMMKGFTVNGTYYEGDVPTIKHDFTKSEKYIEALERDTVREFEDPGTFSESLYGAIGIILLLMLALPVVIIVLAVKYSGLKKKVKQYEMYCGPIEYISSVVNARYNDQMTVQNGYAQGNYYNQQPNYNNQQNTYYQQGTYNQGNYYNQNNYTPGNDYAPDNSNVNNGNFPNE